MKFEPDKVSKIIEENYSLLAPDFFEMQTDYLNSMYAIYRDLDASLIVMLLTRKIYEEAFIQDNKFGNKTSLKNFYQEKKFCVPVAKFKIKEISNSLNLPRETIRRKKIKLIKDKFILFNKKKKTYRLNSDKIDEIIIKTQIELIQLEDDLLSLENQKRPLLESFRSLLNDPTFSEIVVPDSLVFSLMEPDRNILLERINNSNPDLIMAHSEITMNKLRLKKAKLDRLPNLGIGVEKIGTGEKDGSVFSGKDPLVAKLSLDLPIWFGKNKSSIKAANLSVESVEQKVISIQNELGK